MSHREENQRQGGGELIKGHGTIYTPVMFKISVTVCDQNSHEVLPFPEISLKLPDHLREHSEVEEVNDSGTLSCTFNCRPVALYCR